MKIKLDDGAILPRREHPTDAGLDIFSREDKDIIPYGSATFHTGVHVELPSYTAGLIVSKSGLNIKYDITSVGLIDEGYQLVIIPVLYEDLELVEEFDVKTERGNAGFGSTGDF